MPISWHCIFFSALTHVHTVFLFSGFCPPLLSVSVSVSVSCISLLRQAVGVELDLGAIASAAVNAARNGLKMDTYHPQEVYYRVCMDVASAGLWEGF